MTRALVAVLVACGIAAAAADARAAGLGEACKSDRDCPLGSICGSSNVCTALPAKKNVIPFYFSQPGESGYRHVVPLLYFHSWDKHHDTRVQIPFFAHTRDRDHERATTTVPLLLSSLTRAREGTSFRIWPLVWMGHYDDGGQAAMLPLFWWQKRAGHTWFVAPLLLSGGQRDEQRDITEAVLGLVGYYRRHGEFDTWRILAPILFEHETRDTRTLIGPLIWFHRRPGHNAGVLFPFVWETHDEETGYDHTLVLPLFDWESEEHGHKQRIISIVAAYERDDSAGLRTWLVYAPILYHRADRKRTVDVVPPLFTRWAASDGSTAGVIAGPLVSESDAQGSTTALVPIYWRFHDKHQDATTHVLFPIAGFHHHTGARGGLVGPVYGWSSERSDGWGAGVAPVLMFGRVGPRRHVMVLPAFAHFSDKSQGTQTTAVGPLYVRTSRDGGDGGLFPLVFAGRHAQSSYALVPGLYFHRGNRDGALDVVGPFYVARGGRGWAAGLAPIAFFGAGEGRTHQLVLPFFIHATDRQARTERLLIGPFFHRRDGDETADVLFPLFYLRRAPAEGFGLWAIGGYARANGVSTTVVGPFIHRRNANTQSRTSMLFPLLTLHDAPGYSVRVLFPLVWHIRDGNETDTAIFPLYFRGRSPDRRWDAVFPLFMHTHTAVADTTLVGPLWVRTRPDGSRGAGLFPLFAFNQKVGTDGKRSTWFGMPGVYADRNQFTGTAHVWAGLFFHVSQPDGYTSGLIPLVFAWRRGTASKIISPIFYRQSDAARDYAFNWFLLGWYGHEGRARQFGLFPLVFASTHADQTWAAGVFPLFYAKRRSDGSTLATLLGGWITSSAGKRFYVGPFYYRHEGDVTAGGFLPLVYHQRNAATGARVSLGLPIYFEDRFGDGRELAAYSPLVWRYHTIESTTLLGLPLFFDIHQLAESRITGLLPLFVHTKSEVSRSSSWLLPPLLVWWRTAPEGNDGVFFPLVWRFGGKNPTTIVAPFVWDFVRGESRTTVYFPFGAHWRRPDSEHTLAPFVYYKKGLGPKQGSWYLNVFPLFALGRPRTHDLEWYFLEGLFGYSRQGRNRNLRLLWVLDLALEPVPTSNLSWFGSTAPSARELF
jgi:hypothetical protein